MARLALVLVLVLLTSGPASAEPVSGLYRGEAIITGQDNLDERARGMRLALVQVLVKACGDDRVADHPSLPAILANAESYALGYEYEDRKKGIQISDEQGTRDRSFHFRVDFDPEAVDGILHRLGLAAWHRDRPRLLVALAVTDHQGPFIVGTEIGRGVGQRETLLIDARRRGIPLVLPRMDSVETMAVSHQEVSAVNGPAVGALATAYGADAALIGTMEITAAGYWDTDWTLLADGMPIRWSVPGTTFDRAIADGLGQSARVLAGSP